MKFSGDKVTVVDGPFTEVKDVEDFGEGFAPNEEIAKVKF